MAAFDGRASGSGRLFAGKGIVMREWAGQGGPQTFGELRAEQRRDDSFPESGSGVIGIGVSVHLDGGVLCGHPNALMIPLTI